MQYTLRRRVCAVNAEQLKRDRQTNMAAAMREAVARKEHRDQAGS